MKLSALATAAMIVGLSACSEEPASNNTSQAALNSSDFVSPTNKARYDRLASAYRKVREQQRTGPIDTDTIRKIAVLEDELERVAPGTRSQLRSEEQRKDEEARAAQSHDNADNIMNEIG